MELQRAGLLRFSLIVGASVADDARHSRASANLIGTALQLAGEGLYNYFNLDDLQAWMQTSTWGNKSRHRSLQDMPTGTGKAPFRLVIRDELATANV